MSKQDYKDMSIVDRFELLKDYYNHMDKTTSQGQIDIAASKLIKQASVLTLTKEGAGSNFSTTLVAENKNENLSEIVREPVWNKFRYFGQFFLEKVNFPENALFYINQAYLTVQKSKKIFYGEYFL